MENENREVFNITWQGIDIEITCCEPDYMRSHREIYGSGMFHIEIRSVSPERSSLPITETGYKSIFIAESELASHGGALQYVTSYMEEEAKSPKWLDLQVKATQYQLF